MKIKRVLNVIYYVFVLSCLVYGIGSITYADKNPQSPDVLITYNANGKSGVEKANLFGDELWYPGKEKTGLIRINNNFRKIEIESLGLDIDIKQFNQDFLKDMVYNSFLNNMKLTIIKDNLIFDDIIADEETLAELIKDGININTIGPIDLNYTLKMDKAAGNELQNLIANVTFVINAKSDETPTDDDDDNNNGGGSNNGNTNGSTNNKPTPSKTFDGELIDRMPGYIALNEMKKIDEKKDEIIIPFNIDLLKANPNHTPRIYYWNELAQKWVALASYVVTPYTVKAINDGGYTGWFNVFGVIQSSFTDILGHWAEPVTNRMNGLGIIEGYPGSGWTRPAQLEQNITRTEFTALIFRLLNINPDIVILETYNLEDAMKILNEHYQDAKEIPEWVAGVVASTTKAGLIETREGKFAPNEPITQLEAAVMVSKAFKVLEKYHPIDLTKFKDAEDIPDWGIAAVSKNVVEGYPDNTFKTNDFITRAEALTVLKRLFVIGMGL